MTNPRKAAYNRIYSRTTFGLSKGSLVILLVLIPVTLLHPGCKGQKPANAEPSTRPPVATAALSAASAPTSTSAPSAIQTVQRRIHVFISGRVQGVGFRAFTQEQAQRLKLIGFVRNLDDGRVEMVAEGPATDIEKLIVEVKHGPPSARVDKLDCTDEKPRGDYKGFSIK
jgi:acylphosphatase